MIPAIPYTLAHTLLELAALPVHLAAFLLRRGRIRARIRRVLAETASARAGAADRAGSAEPPADLAR